MPPNIFGNVDKEGLSNPLTEDLQGADFNIYDINELHINELHDQDSVDKIRVHEDFNMLNNSITNMADPVASKDAVTLSYYEANLPTTTETYDVMAAFTDEQTPITVGIQAGSLRIPRTFNCSSVIFYLRNGATASPYQLTFYIDGVAQTFAVFPDFINAGDTISQTGSFPSGIKQLVAGSEITIGANTDATASGLKLVLLGEL
jgi:hypothetical protein